MDAINRWHGIDFSCRLHPLELFGDMCLIKMFLKIVIVLFFWVISKLPNCFSFTITAPLSLLPPLFTFTLFQDDNHIAACWSPCRTPLHILSTVIFYFPPQKTGFFSLSLFLSHLNLTFTFSQDQDCQAACRGRWDISPLWNWLTF